MVRTSKAVVGLIVVGSVGALFLAYSGTAAPYVAPSQLPGTMGHAIAAAVGIAVGGLLVSRYLDRRAWKRTGRAAGLSPEGGGLLGRPDLTGTVRGYPVRVHTYSARGGHNDTSKTFTVVGTDLDDPVDWRAMVAHSSEEETADLGEIGGNRWIEVDGEFGVWGPVSEAFARTLLTDEVRDALTALDGGVAVGDVDQQVVGAMRESIPDGADSMAAGIAQGMLEAATDVAGDGPAKRITVEDRGLLLDAAELERRVAAVTALREAVERTETAPTA